MSLQSNDQVWAERPARQWIHHMAVARVMYLLELRVCLLEKMLTDFIDGVDIFLGLHRDADPATLAKLEVGVLLISKQHSVDIPASQLQAMLYISTRHRLCWNSVV